MRPDVKTYLMARRESIVKAISEMQDEVRQIDRLLVDVEFGPTTVEKIMDVMKDQKGPVASSRIVAMVMDRFADNTKKETVWCEIVRLGKRGRLRKVGRGVWQNIR